MFFATDIANFLACHHLITLDRAQAAGEIQKPVFHDPGTKLLRELGIRHEQAFLGHLAQTKEVVRIPSDILWTDAVARTVEALHRGVDAVYQATFQVGPWGGRSDFLIRVDKPSALGPFSYEVVETKLARSAKARAILQLCFYSELLSRIQGVPPEWMYAVLGGGTKLEKFAAQHYSAYFRKVRQDFEEASRIARNTYPEPVELCDVCSWFPLCDKRRRDDDHLSLVAGITQMQRKRLSARQVNTVARLGSLSLPAVPKIDGIGTEALHRVRDQACIQVRGRNDGQLLYELLEPMEEGKGLAALPLPSPGDIFLDFEAVPYAFDTGLEYLIGVVTLPDQAGAEPIYRSWHRREEKSGWWEYFRLCELSDTEIEEDKSALGGLSYVGEVERVKRSAIHRYRFPPQDYAVDRAYEVHDPKTQKSAGDFVTIDELNSTIDLKRGVSSTVPHPGALIPYDMVGSDVLRDSLMRLGFWVAGNGISALGPFSAARNLLLRRPPQSVGSFSQSIIDDNGQLSAAARDLVNSIAQEASILPVQGPPGSGKTYTGARMIVELVKHGRRVGITATSHKVISNLLGEVCKVAREASVALRAVQKANETDGCQDPMVTQVDPNRGNQEILDALAQGEAQVAGGTAWLWARSEMSSSVDMLFIDEAGQMSLANVLAISQAATSSVLLGDPQQLDQPQKGIHPPGAEGSAFDHLLQGRATITSNQGLFLAETQRLHPEICAFTSELFYEGRLAPRPENQLQRLNTDGPLSGTGLRFAPVAHSGRQSESEEEIERISQLIDGLLGQGSTWTNRKGETRNLTLNDVLVVAPYNAQVAALARKLPGGARIGTVDKFQGQEAPVAFYSMTTSTPEDAPRGMEFLYSLNRLNVAVSRARCVAVLVASPALFQVECKTPQQIMLANAFCRYLEMAKVI